MRPLSTINKTCALECRCRRALDFQGSWRPGLSDWSVRRSASGGSCGRRQPSPIHLWSACSRPAIISFPHIDPPQIVPIIPEYVGPITEIYPDDPILIDSFPRQRPQNNRTTDTIAKQNDFLRGPTHTSTPSGYPYRPYRKPDEMTTTPGIIPRNELASNHQDPFDMLVGRSHQTS